MREKFIRFMNGRNGMDELARAESSLDDLKKTWMAKLNDDCIFVSAKNRDNIDEFRDVLYRKVRQLHVQKYPYNDFLYPEEE